MLSRYIIVLIGIVSLIVILNCGCKKCYTCKYEYREYRFYKGSDTILVNVSGYYPILRRINELTNDGYVYINTTKDSLYFEEVCNSENKQKLKINGANCFPKK
jgi:hypothetical protein